MLVGYSLIVGLFLLGCSAVIPTQSSQCGADGKVALTTTVIPNATVYGLQLFYVDNTKVVFLKTRPSDFRSKDVLYRSDNYGKTWTLQTVPSIMEGYAGEGIYQVFTAKAAKQEGRNTLYFLAASGNKMWVTSDAGATYSFFDNVPSGIRWLYPHDLYPSMLLATRRLASTSDDEVYLVSEFGKTWKKLANVPRYSRVSWSIFPRASPQRIYLQTRPSVPVPGAEGDFDSVLVYSDDYFQTQTQVPINNIHQWTLLPPNKLIITSCLEVKGCQHVKLFISEDAGATFHAASFPNFEHELQNDTSIRIYEASDDVIWAFTTRNCPTHTFCYGDLFHSYAADKEFTLSLQYIRRYDFTKYESLDGIYVANQYTNIEEADDAEMRTLITFNKGSSWNVLEAPEKDANGQPTNCFLSKGCSLHLHGHSDTAVYPDFFYSVPNAIGVMLASGNTGNILLDREDEVNLYYSRNGGITWQEVRRGRYVTEIGNHGTAIVAALVGTPTTKLVYTIDEGDTWSDCVIASEDIEVKNIRVSKGWDSTEFLLYGGRGNDAVLVHVDFTNAYDGKCKPGTSDFESWSPTDEHGDCFMGRRVQYERRAVGRKCYLDEDHIHTISSTNCSCTDWDYECAECFYRPTLDGQCRLECTTPELGPIPHPPSETFCEKSNATHPIYYEVDIGYDLVDEDSCTVGLGEHLKPKGVVSCETWKDLTKHSSFFPHVSMKPVLIVMALLLVLSVVGGFYAYKTNDRFRAIVTATMGWKTDDRDISYQQLSGQSLASSEEDVLADVKNEKLHDQLESEETSS